MINQERFEKNFREISKFGALEGGGLSRLAYSKEEKEARNFLLTKLKQNGFDIKQDSVGNIFATLKGDENLEAVAVGSHIDSVPYGGFYDGTLGVMAGYEALLSIKENDFKHKRPLTLIIFACEESSRFNMATAGSKMMTGKLSLQKTKELKDKDGISLYDAIVNFGCDISKFDDVKLPKDCFYSYLELHIEQGPVLEANKIPIGIVTGIAAPIRYQLTIKGRADHSGATPMNLRADALVGAAHIIAGIEDIAKNQSGPTTVATVGYANATPGVLNVIPAEVLLGIDIRDIDNDNLLKADKKIADLINAVCQKRGLGFELKQLAKDMPVKLDEKMINMLKDTAQNLNIKSINLPSGAGHDAMHMNNISKFTGMLFIPCKDGISHNIKEEIDFKDAINATKILADALLKLSNE